MDEINKELEGFKKDLKESDFLFKSYNRHIYDSEITPHKEWFKKNPRMVKHKEKNKPNPLVKLFKILFNL